MIHNLTDDTIKLVSLVVSLFENAGKEMRSKIKLNRIMHVPIPYSMLTTVDKFLVFIISQSTHRNILQHQAWLEAILINSSFPILGCADLYRYNAWLPLASNSQGRREGCRQLRRWLWKLNMRWYYKVRSNSRAVGDAQTCCTGHSTFIACNRKAVGGENVVFCILTVSC